MNKFESLGLDQSIIKAITELGFENPTPVQEKTLPHLLSTKTDLVALAQTGTGKTAAFGLPLLSTLDFESKNTQALILCPTRELCMQITKDIQNFSKYMRGVNVVAVYGGASIQNQLADIKRGAQIIVATPGRMVDIISRKRVNLSTVGVTVLDEADEMLNMGFKEDLDTILSETPKEKNTWLFSATMPDEVLRISREYMNKPLEITIGGKNQGAETIEHMYYVVHASDKYPALKRIADFNPDIFAIVFCRTKIETQQIADKLIKDGYNADALHGDLSQSQRDHVMKRYRSRSLQFLVATDVAARGIDVNDVTHVINYTLPDELSSYTHRSGRTARAGKTGVSIVIINMREMGKVREIERIIKKKFTQQQVPGGFQVCEKQLFHLVKRVHDVEVNEEEIKTYLPKIYDELNELTKEEIIKRFVSMEFNRFLEYYKNAPDLNGSHSHEGSYAPMEKGIVKLFINLGKFDKFEPDSLREYIATTACIDIASVTGADLNNSYSFLKVKTEVLPAILAAFVDQNYRSRRVHIESKGNREEGIPRTRERGERSYGGGSDRGGRSYGGGRSAGGDRRERSYSGGRSSGGEKSYSSRPSRERSFGERNKEQNSDRERSSREKPMVERNSSKPPAEGKRNKYSGFSKREK